MYRAVYTVIVLEKRGCYDDATYFNEKTQIIPTFHPLKESVCQIVWQEKKCCERVLVTLQLPLLKKYLKGLLGAEVNQSLLRKNEKHS